MPTLSSPDINPVEFLTDFSELCDPRRELKVTYPLPEILLLTLCAGLSGTNDWVAISIYETKKLALLRKWGRVRLGAESYHNV